MKTTKGLGILFLFFIFSNLIYAQQLFILTIKSKLQ